MRNFNLKKESMIDDINYFTKQEILNIATISDQLNLQAEYNLADSTRKTEIEAIWQQIADLRTAGQSKKDAINSATTWEELAAAV